MTNQGTESQFEDTTIERLRALGYEYQPASTLDRDLKSVVLADRLRAHLAQRYPHLPEKALGEAVAAAGNPDGVTLDQRNMSFHQMLTRGYELKYEVDGQDRYELIYFIDWDEPDNNDFLVVNQLTVEGANTRRPDIVIYVNGLPLVVFELKNPWAEQANVAGAYNQLQHYRHDIPRLFEFNACCVLSDGTTTLQGVHSADYEWFTPWKSIDGRTVEPETTGAMKTLIEGLFPKARLLDYVRHFIVHEVVNEQITKKGAKYHQYFAVRFAVEKALEASRPDGDRRIGVVWHTQGAGKSLSMIFFVGILRRHPAMENPSFVIQVDRADLDNQLYSSFVAAKALVGTVHQAQTIPDLRRLLQTEGGEVICSTIEKFQTREDESRHPELSRRRNIIVIADEAHRTQYGFLGGFAEHLHVALPNASFIGYTATPIDKEDANTFLVFGDIIHTYDMQQATQDGAVVGLYYEPRLIPLDLVNPDIDADLQEITEAEDYEIEATTLERAKARWATVAEAAGRRERLEHLADDLLAHFRERCDVIDGKAMIVCMIRANCVKLYDALTGRPDCPEVKVVMTGYLAEDPPEWSQAGHITTHTQREAIKARFKDPEDPLRLVIVCDMWLTGFDNPCLHTLYVDKPMKGHNLMQAIARVNRVFRDKPAGVIVDYIGIGDELRAATRKYTAAGGRGELAPELQTEAVAVFLDQLDRVRAFLPAGQPYHRWRDLPGIELEDLLNLCYGTLAPDEETRDHFLTEEKRLSKAFSLVKHLDVGRQHTEEVALYQLVRRQLRKTEPQQTMQMRQLEGAVQDLLDESITAQPAVDIFRVAGLDRADISILDDEFLAGFKPGATTDLQLKLLEKLLEDEIRLRRRSNLAKYRSFQEMLEDALRRYHNNTIQAADVVRVMVEIRRQMLEDDRRKSELGLTDEELAFYDAITYGEEAGLVQDIDFLAELVQEVVEAIKRNLQVDWTRDHRQDVYAGVQSAVKLVLRKRRIRGEQFRFILRRVMQQAEAGYEDWPMVA